MLHNYLVTCISEFIQSIIDMGVFSISILISSYDEERFHNIHSFPYIVLSYILEKDVDSLPLLSEERWNIAYWNIEHDYILLHPYEDPSGADMLYHWFELIHVNNIGVEDESKMYNDNMEYIGKGPNGYWELYEEIVASVLDVRASAGLETSMQKIPIIIHDYDYSWYTERFTKTANPNHQADAFLEYYKKEYKNG